MLLFGSMLNVDTKQSEDKWSCISAPIPLGEVSVVVF